jgi:hypothetical protein
MNCLPSIIIAFLVGAVVLALIMIIAKWMDGEK